jgi:iron complex outermembrane receptor protein
VATPTAARRPISAAAAQHLRRRLWGRAGLRSSTSGARNCACQPDTGRFRWQLGGIYFDLRDYTEFDQRAYFLTSNALGGTPNPNNWVLLHNVNTSWAVFGQASYDLTEKLRLTAGARLSNDTKNTTLSAQPPTLLRAVTFPASARATPACRTRSPA